MPVLFFYRCSFLAADRDSVWLDRYLLSPSTAILFSYYTIHVGPELTLPLHIQMKDIPETVEVAWANSLNTGISIFCIYLPLQLS